MPPLSKCPSPGDRRAMLRPRPHRSLLEAPWGPSPIPPPLVAPHTRTWILLWWLCNEKWIPPGLFIRPCHAPKRGLGPWALSPQKTLSKAPPHHFFGSFKFSRILQYLHRHTGALEVPAAQTFLQFFKQICCKMHRIKSPFLV